METELNNFGKIGVLMGGPSSEREVSLKSGRAVYEVLKNQALDAVAIDIQTDKKHTNHQLIQEANIDIAFIALHGHFGEDGQVQALLEEMNIPYTGSDPDASRLAMDKIASRQIFQEKRLPVPDYVVLSIGDPESSDVLGVTCPDGVIRRSKSSRARGYFKEDYTFEAACRADTAKENFIRYDRRLIPRITQDLLPPFVVKPARQGSSIGLSIVETQKYLNEAIEYAFVFDERVIIEKYIPGREITVGILGDSALPVVEIMPQKKFYDYEAKYKPGKSNYVVPAALSAQLTVQIQDTAFTAHKLLGCSAFSRVDMRLSPDNIPFVLEVNSIPGLTSTSLLPKAARAAGIDFAQLCINILRLAYERSLKK